MAAPTYITASTGTTDAGGAWSHTSAAPGAAGRIYIVQVVQDGTGANTISVDSVTNAENLAGTDGVLTSIGEFNIGSAVAASQHLWIGRSLNTSAMVITGGNTGTDDLYIRVYEFSGVSTGTTLATVIENATAGSTTTGAGTSTTVADASVQTLGTNRLALNFIGTNDDLTIGGSFTGETGGDWASVASYGTSTGTDAALNLNTATIASAGTIDGGTYTITSMAWGVVGFALIPVALSLTVDAATFNLTGAAVTLTKQSKLTSNEGSFNFTGSSVGLIKGYRLIAEAGVFNLTGSSVTLTKQSKITAEAGVFVFTGSSASLTAQRTITTDQGSFLFTGSDANLIYTPSGDSTISVNPGSFIFTGSDVNLIVGGTPVIAQPGGSGWFVRDKKEEKKKRISKDDDECLMIVKLFMVCESENTF